MSLYEFGFKDFLVNEYLLEKHEDIEMVANMLISGQVTTEQINEIHA